MYTYVHILCKLCDLLLRMENTFNLMTVEVDETYTFCKFSTILFKYTPTNNHQLVSEKQICYAIGIPKLSPECAHAED